MIFKRRPKYPELQFSDRQIKAIQKRPERQAKRMRERLPLFADQIEVDAIDVDAEIDRRKLLAANSEQIFRNADAKNWREGRAEFFAAPLQIQIKVAIHWAFWCQTQCPAKPTYFIYVVQLYTRPWRLADQRNPKVAARQAWIEALKQTRKNTHAKAA